MSKVNRRPDLDQRVKELERRIVQVDTRPAFDPDIQPGPPTGLGITFVLREQKERPNYFAKFTWNAVTAGACEADIDYYVLQYRPVVFSSGVPVSGERRTRRLDAKPFIDDAINPYYITDELPRPKKWTWEFRVQVVNNGNIKGAFSSWFRAGSTPHQDSRPTPPTPTGVALFFDKQTKGKRIRWRAKIVWDEVQNWDVPGGDQEEDVAKYIVQIRRTNNAGNPITDASGDEIRRTKKRPAKDEDANNFAVATFLLPSKWHYWQARVRTVDRFNRRGAWSAWTTQGRPADTGVPPTPKNVKMLSGPNRVILEWDDPPHEEDSVIPDDDVAYYQVELATKSNFSTVVFRDRYTNANRKAYRTQRYKQRYWGRVRSVDEDGQKSAWVKRGPVRPSKTSFKSPELQIASLGIEEDVDFSNEAGVEVIGHTTNQAKAQSLTGLKVAWVPCEVVDGVLTSRLRLSPTSNRAVAGVCFLLKDLNDYLFVLLRKTGTGSSDAIELKKNVNGTVTPLASVTSQGLENGSVYGLEVETDRDPATGRTRIRVRLEGVTKITHVLSSGDETAFNTVNNLNLGLVIEQGASLDDLKSRWDTLTFQACNIADNLLTDDQSGIEVSANGWVAVQGCSIARSTAQAHQGSASLLLTASTNGVNPRASTLIGVNGSAVESGTMYRGFAFVRIGSVTEGQPRASVRIKWYDIEGTFISSSLGIVEDLVLGVWGYRQVEDIAPDGAYFASLEVETTTAGILGEEIKAGDTFYVDTAFLGVHQTVVDDTFNRTASTSSLGSASSGQVWTADGTWGVDSLTTPTGTFGVSTISPLFYAEDMTTYSRSWNVGDHRYTAADTIVIDRPTKFFLWAVIDINNNDPQGDAAVFRLYIVLTVDGGSRQHGRFTATRIITSDGVQSITHMRQFLAIPSGDTATVAIEWDVQTGAQGGAVQNADILRQKMIYAMFYAPDIDPANNVLAPQWTKSAKTISSFQRLEPNDV